MYPQMMALMWIAALTAAALALAQASTPAPSSTPQQATADQPASKAKLEKPKKPKMICTDEGETGSFLTKRVCRTPEQVEAERQASRRNADDTLDRSQLCRGSGC